MLTLDLVILVRVVFASDKSENNYNVSGYVNDDEVVIQSALVFFKMAFHTDADISTLQCLKFILRRLSRQDQR